MNEIHFWFQFIVTIFLGLAPSTLYVLSRWRLKLPPRFRHARLGSAIIISILSMVFGMWATSFVVPKIHSSKNAIGMTGNEVAFYLVIVLFWVVKAEIFFRLKRRKSSN